jgi:hypothetical protein
MQLMCFLPALPRSTNSSSIAASAAKIVMKAPATKSAALIECFRTMSLPALITGLTIKRDYIRYSTYEPLTNIDTLRSLKRGAQSDDPHRE